MISGAFPSDASRPIVYVAGAVTHASEPFRDFVHSFKQNLRTSSSALVLEWIERDSPAIVEDFFRRDLNNVSLCDVMIALVDEPSIGLGMELEKAIIEKKRLLCLMKRGQAVSRLLMSAHESLEMPLRTYNSLQEAVDIACDFISEEKEIASATKRFA